MIKKIIIGCLLLTSPLVVAKQDYKDMTKSQIKEAKEIYNEKIVEELKASELYDTYQKALSGNTDEQLKLGIAYFNNNGLKRNNEEAEKWLKLAEKDHIVEVNTIFKKLYGTKKFKDFYSMQKETNAIKNLANQNNVYMMIELAERYRRGYGTKHSYKKHLYWSFKANDYKEERSDYILSNKNKINTSKKSNIENNVENPKIKEVFTMTQIYPLVKEYSTNKYKEEINHQKEIIKEISEGEYNIAKVYYHGTGKKKNMKLAYQYFKESAEHGNRQSQYELARILTEKTFNNYTSNPMKEAFDLFTAIKDNGSKISNAVVYWQLSKMYYYGNGVEKDLEKAKELKDEAALNGFEKSY